MLGLGCYLQHSVRRTRSVAVINSFSFFAVLSLLHPMFFTGYELAAPGAVHGVDLSRGRLRAAGTGDASLRSGS